MLLGRFIYGKLTSDNDVTALVGDRVFPVFLPQNAPYPAIVYMVNNAPLDSNMKDKSAYHDRATVTFYIWADHSQGQQGYDDLDSIDVAIRAVFGDTYETVNGVTVEAVKYIGSQDGRDEERTLFLRESTYVFTSKN